MNSGINLTLKSLVWLLASAVMLAPIAACGGGSSTVPSTGPSALEPAARPPSPLEVAFPEVWSSNGYDGQTYEFKSNCVGDFVELETCFLWDMTAVAVEAPTGERFELQKDFNVQAYSGEVTRRWVLYGPPGVGLPEPGDYRFPYYRNADLALTQVVSYSPETVDYPTGVLWRRDGNDLVVQWTPPAGARPGMNYKVLIFPDSGNVISNLFEWDASSARLPNVPLDAGATGTINVAIYFSGGYAYSERLSMTW